MRSLRFLSLIAAALLSMQLRADVNEYNGTPCTTKVVVVKQYVFNDGVLGNCPTWEANVAYGATLNIPNYYSSWSSPDQWGNPAPHSYEIRYETLYTYSVAAACDPAVVGITGLPEVVCLGEDYDVTAQSSGGTLTAMQWFGDAQIVSQSGHSAVVRFNAFGSSKTLIARNNVGSNPPQITKTTDVPSISYSIPARHGNGGLPRSIPYNVNTTISVTITGTTKPLKFQIVGNGGNNGQVAIQGSDTLSGSGNLVIKGTAQTAPGHAGQITIRTSTKPASMCGPSDGFSVCAHPIRYDWAKHATVNGTVSGGSRFWGVQYAATPTSDSGDAAHMTEISSIEVITNGSKNGIFANDTDWNSGWLPILTQDVRVDELSVGGNSGGNPVSAPAFNAYIHSNGPNSEKAATQIMKFACTRCGIAQSASSPIIATSGTGHAFATQPQSSGASIYNVNVTKASQAVSGTAAAAVTNPGPHAVPIN